MNLKKLLLYLPEFLFLDATIIYWFAEGLVFNPLAIILFVIMLQQLLFRARVSGLIISSAGLLIGLYLLLALFSELSEFATFNSQAQELLAGGLALCLSLITLSTFMFKKYLSSDFSSENLKAIKA